MTTHTTPAQLAADHAAQTLRLHGTGAHHRDLAHDGAPHNREAHLAAAQTAFDASNAAYAISTLTRALAEHAPEAAAQIVAEIAISLEKGYGPEEAYAQAREDGTDPEELIEAGRQAARNY